MAKVAAGLEAGCRREGRGPPQAVVAGACMSVRCIAVEMLADCLLPLPVLPLPLTLTPPTLLARTDPPLHPRCPPPKLVHWKAGIAGSLYVEERRRTVNVHVQHSCGHLRAIAVSAGSA